MKKYSLNCWKPLKLFELQHSHEIWTSAICDESRKNRMDDARLNPKHRDNGQSAAKLRTGERSTTILARGVHCKRLTVEVVHSFGLINLT